MCCDTIFINLWRPIYVLTHNFQKSLETCTCVVTHNFQKSLETCICDVTHNFHKSLETCICHVTFNFHKSLETSIHDVTHNFQKPLETCISVVTLNFHYSLETCICDVTLHFKNHWRPVFEVWPMWVSCRDAIASKNNSNVTQLTFDIKYFRIVWLVPVVSAIRYLRRNIINF